MEIYAQLDLADSSLHPQDCLWAVSVPKQHNIESIIEQELLTDKFTDIGDHINRHLKTDGLFILDYRFKNSSDTTLKIGSREECILMEFLLTGSNGMGDDFSGKHNLRFFTGDSITYDLQSNSLVDYFCIFMSPDFYFNLIGRTSMLDNSFAVDIRNGISTMLTEGYLPMNYEMFNVISKVRNCTRTGSLHRFCLEIKLQELLLLQFEQFHDMFVHITPKQQLHESDAERIKTAKKILEESYNSPPTIQQLSRMVGINEYKLKKGFKELFQHTIHEYVTYYRMQKANRMIKEQQLQIREIAVELGYKNPSHFSAAFKKHFGFLPTEMVG